MAVRQAQGCHSYLFGTIVNFLVLKDFMVLQKKISPGSFSLMSDPGHADMFHVKPFYIENIAASNAETLNMLYLARTNSLVVPNVKPFK